MNVLIMTRKGESDVHKCQGLALVLGDQDNVATAIDDIPEAGEYPVMFKDGIKTVNVLVAIPFGHKFAVSDIAAGGDIVKYGEVIGEATTNIKTGEHVHVHNVVSKRGRGDLEAKGAN